MATAILQFLGTAAVIIVAGVVLTRCADTIAELTGLGRMLVGMVLIAAATSLPELAVDLSAMRLGIPNLGVGDLLGSSLYNLLILAVLDLLHRGRTGMLSHASAAHALSGTMSIALTALAGIAVLLGPRWPQASLAGIGIPAWVILAVFIFGVRIVYFDQRLAGQKADSAPTAGEAGQRRTLRRALLGYVAAAAVILITGPFLARAAGRIAELSGLGESFVGTAFVALSTSLPELSTSLTALRMKAYDLILGNILGSNSFNMALFAPLDLAYRGSLFAAVASTQALTALAVILVTTVVIAGQLYHAERRIRFIEPDALLVIALVIASLALIFFVR
jgi:cation:H+ antiporter